MNFNRIGHESMYAAIAKALGEYTQGLEPYTASQKACDAVLRVAMEVGISPYLTNYRIESDEIPKLAQKAYLLSQRLMPMNIKEMRGTDVLEIFWNAYMER